jgi:hypothetical protein
MAGRGNVCHLSRKDFVKKRKINYIAVTGIFFAVLLFIIL